MFKFFSRLFAKPAPKFCTIEGYWCRTPVKFDARSPTPHGGKVGDVTVMVDVDYLVVGQDVRVRGVRLSPKTPNVAAVKRKDAWHAATVCSDGDLTKSVTTDLQDRDGFLWRAMFARWNDTFGKPTSMKRAAR